MISGNYVPLVLGLKSVLTAQMTASSRLICNVHLGHLLHCDALCTSHPCFVEDLQNWAYFLAVMQQSECGQCRVQQDCPRVCPLFVHTAQSGLNTRP
eukprot:6476362-Amphidinium_carterae.1